MAEQVALFLFVTLPFLPLLAAVPVAWGWGLGWHDVVIALVFYAVAGLGITVGFHRYFTHGSFKAKRWLRVTLALAGSLAIEGPVIHWVADHRRHHAFSDREGDPHSPWRFGDDAAALAKGLWYAHMGWLFDRELTNRGAFAPDLVAGPGHPPGRPAVPGARRDLAAAARRCIGGLLVLVLAGRADRVLLGRARPDRLLHHVTWSINSICHVSASARSRRRRQVRQLLAAGDPVVRRVLAQPAPRRPDLRPARRAARPDRHQRPAHLDLREVGWASDVRWPKPERLDAKRVAT